MKLKLAILEDEREHQLRTSELIEQWALERKLLVVVDPFSNVPELEDEALHYDAFVLDIDMQASGGCVEGGYAFAKGLRAAGNLAPLVFTTSNTTLVFSTLPLLNIVGFCVKPLDNQEEANGFFIALDAVNKYIGVSAKDFFSFQVSARGGAKGKEGDQHGVTMRMLYRDVFYFSLDAGTNYVIVNGDEGLRFRSSITQLMKRLPECFVQIEQAVIVNISKVERLTENGVMLCSKVEGELPVSRRYMPKLKETVHRSRTGELEAA